MLEICSETYFPEIGGLCCATWVKLSAEARDASPVPLLLEFAQQLRHTLEQLGGYIPNPSLYSSSSLLIFFENILKQ